jgi:protein SCO1/2
MRGLNILKKIIVLALILALPGFLYYLLTTKGQNRYVALNIYGPKLVEKTTHRVQGKDIPDTLYHTLSDFNLQDQNGNKVSFKTFEGKIFIANFFYAHCPTICSEANKNMDSLVSEYIKSKMVYFVSITVDPQRDSVAALKKYAAQFAVQSPKWLFLTGDTSTIYPLARNGFLVNAVKDGNDFIYSDKMILIDEEKRIRGYYSATMPDDIQKLSDEIKVLLSEEILKKDKAVY